MPRCHGGDLFAFAQEQRKKLLDFSANISPLGMPDAVRRAAMRAVADADAYPDPACRSLREALARRHGLALEQILCGNGAADIIDRLGVVLAAGRKVPAMKKKKTVLLTAPSFSEYRLAMTRAGLCCRAYLLRRAHDFLLQEDFLDWITPDLAAVILCEPNNPTGQTTDAGLLARIRAACREQDVLLVADECFQEFLADPDAHTLQRFFYLPDAGRMLVIKSMTKCYAMAGLRLGYCMSTDAALLAALADAAQPWAVSGPAQAAGEAALAENAYLQQLRDLNRTQRERLREGLAACGCELLLGEANYLFFRHARTDLAQRLLRQGIVIRTCADYEGLDAHWYRVSVRTEEENGRLLAAMEHAYGKMHHDTGDDVRRGKEPSGGGALQDIPPGRLSDSAL